MRGRSHNAIHSNKTRNRFKRIRALPLLQIEKQTGTPPQWSLEAAASWPRGKPVEEACDQGRARRAHEIAFQQAVRGPLAVETGC